MSDAWTELDSIIRHQGDYAEVERERTELVHWKTRAERAEREARAWQEKTRRLAEAVKEERDLHEVSYNDLLKDKNSLEEKCSLLESKMLKLIDMVKSGKFSQSGSQIQMSPRANDSADLVVEMEKRLKEAKQEAEKSNIELAQSKERVSLIEGKLRQLAEVLRTEREASQKSAAENQSIEIDLLKKKLGEAAQREQTLKAELSQAQSSSQASPQAANAQESERKAKELEDKLQKIAVGVRKERELKAAEVSDLKTANEKLSKRLANYQERLTAVEQELQAKAGSNGGDDGKKEKELRMWREKAEEAEERAKRAEMDAQDKISDYRIKVKHLLVQQEAKFKEQSSGGGQQHSGTEEAEQRCRALEQRNRELEAALAALQANSSATPISAPPPMSMGAPPPPPPPAGIAAPPPPPPAAMGAPPTAPPPPSGGGTGARSGPPASLMDAIKQGASLKKAPAGGAPKPKPAVSAPAGPNLAQMAAELANQRRQRMLNNTQTDRGFRRSVRLDIILEDVNNS